MLLVFTAIPNEEPVNYVTFIHTHTHFKQINFQIVVLPSKL